MSTTLVQYCWSYRDPLIEYVAELCLIVTLNHDRLESPAVRVHISTVDRRYSKRRLLHITRTKMILFLRHSTDGGGKSRLESSTKRRESVSPERTDLKRNRLFDSLPTQISRTNYRRSQLTFLLSNQPWRK